MIKPTDALFFQTINKLSIHNAKGVDQKYIRTFRESISSEAMELLGFENDDLGGWFGNVYILFTPLFQEVEAEEWMK